jgi:hypothetical protein
MKTVYNAIYTQLSTNETLLEYVGLNEFVRGFKEVLPAKKYMIILEPGPETEQRSRKQYDKTTEALYEFHIYCRLLLQSSKVESAILGNDNYKGLLDFCDDVKAAIRQDMSFAYNTYGRSLSSENAADSFDLSASETHLTVSIDGKTPAGYDAINCGSSAGLSGVIIAENIQASLRLLGRYADDGYQMATCTFNPVNNQFTISSANIGPESSVVVSAGAANDASAVLGFTSPTEYSGTNLIKTEIESVTVENGAFPVRYRMIPIAVTEEILIGG